MTYKEIQDTVDSLNTGSLPDKIDVLCKLIAGKIARKRLPDLIKLAEITTAGATSFDLRTLLPDFLSFKQDINNENRIIYSLDNTGSPLFYMIVSPGEFAQHTEGGYAKIEGKTLTISVPDGYDTPAKIYFPYYSFYVFADGTTDAAKETPVADDDYLLLTSVFDDVFIEGLLLYISRREKETKEFEKNSIEWEKRLNDVIYYS